MKLTCFALVVFLCSLSSFPSVLSNLAANLKPRSWVKMPQISGMTLDYSLLYWNDSGVWDPVRKQIRWVGGPGTCCASPALYKLIKYDEATNVWSVEGTPFQGSGHAYDGNTVDPATGDHYFTIFEDKRVRWWAGAVWAMLPEFPHAARATMAVAWFPELYGGKGGLVHVAGQGNVAWYTGYFNGNKWTPIPGAGTAPWGTYNTFAEYNPVEKVVWMGGGNGADRVNYKLDTQLKLTKLGNASVTLNNGTTIKSVDPVSGKHIITNLDNNSHWEYDIKNDNWSQISNMANKPTFHNTFHVPIPEYGVILYFDHNNSTKEAWLYRHTAGVGPGSVDAKPAVPSADVVAVSPNPFHSTVAINVRSQKTEDRRQTVGIKIFNVSGKLVYQLTSDLCHLTSGISWNAAHLPSGIYLLKLNTGQKTITKRLFLQK